VRIRSGKEIDVESNTIWAMNDYRVPQAMILLVGAGGSTFTDNVIIRGNTISVTALPPGSAHAVRITQAIADGSSHVLIEGNKLRLDGKPSLMLYDSSPKNHNILILNNNNGGN
jgi:hypothetical protein